MKMSKMLAEADSGPVKKGTWALDSGCRDDSLVVSQKLLIR